MTRRIYKYDLDPERMVDGNRIRITTPALSKPLYATNQGPAQMVLYMLVNLDYPEEDPWDWDVWVYGTGHDIEVPLTAEAMGVCQIQFGQLMFHVFIALVHERDRA